MVLPHSTPDLIELDLLDSIAELGSLGRAASRHRMSQPAVSMRMSQLERRLGLTLLQRSPTGARLTPAGERVVALSRRVLSETRELMAGVEALVAEERSHLRVAASLTVAEYLLPDWLAALHRKSPDAILAVEVTNSAQVAVRVREHHADVGFVEGHQPRLGAMKTAVVRTDHLVMVVDLSHPWAHRQSPVTGPELAAAELIVREPGSGTRQVLEDALGAFGAQRPGRRRRPRHRPPGRCANRRDQADQIAAGGMADRPAAAAPGQGSAQHRLVISQGCHLPVASRALKRGMRHHRVVIRALARITRRPANDNVSVASEDLD